MGAHPMAHWSKVTLSMVFLVAATPSYPKRERSLGMCSGRALLAFFRQNVASHGTLENGGPGLGIASISQLMRIRVAHIVQTILGKQAVLDSQSKGTILPEGRIGHHHVQTSLCTSDPSVLGKPVGDYETLKAQLTLEQAIERLAVLAATAVIDPVVASHDGASTGLDSVLEGKSAKEDKEACYMIKK
ncbi:hypothetical protein GB937_010427 [Aspergillus fischeri]|nr:hypothetical protein GB937_010427 [Aspergillus fischeri]